MIHEFHLTGWGVWLAIVPLLVGSVVCLAGGAIAASAIAVTALEYTLRACRVYGLFVEFIFARYAEKRKAGKVD